MAIIKINEAHIDLQTGEPQIILQNPTGFSVELIDIGNDIRQRILFFGFPIPFDKGNNIGPEHLFPLKKKLRQNNGVNILYRIIENLYRYDYFVVLTVGLDPYDIEFLLKIPDLLNVINKKIYIIRFVYNPKYEFHLKL